MNEEIRPADIFNMPALPPVARDEQRKQDGRFRKELAKAREDDESEDEKAGDKRRSVARTNVRNGEDTPPGETPCVGSNLDVST